MRATICGAASLALLLGTLAAPALAADMPSNVKTATINGQKVLTDSQGKALYTFDRDKAGSASSACTGQCAQLWPPLAAPAGFKPGAGWTEVKGANGANQLALNGKPLYTYSKDQAGQDSGNGFRNVWHVATPAGG